MKHPIKSFDPILEDYAFFEAHSTEAERDLVTYAGHLQGFADTHPFIRMLDFGGGTGSFTSAFLRRAAWSPDHLFLTLVEPGEQARQKALKTLRPFTIHPIAHFPALPEKLDPGFDLILANHVLYYVSDLLQTIDRLSRCLKPGGKCLIVMSGTENALVRCWAHGFGLNGKDIPFYAGNDLQSVLDELKLHYLRQRVDFTIAFPDAPENRLKILRFLFGEHLSALPQTPLLHFFDPYARDGEIRIDTCHYLYVM
jgi:SAM-dependent methyltransferase